MNVTVPCEKSTAEPDAGDTVAFSETVMVGTRGNEGGEPLGNGVGADTECDAVTVDDRL